jgi:hypothetical protein
MTRKSNEKLVVEQDKYGILLPKYLNLVKELVKKYPVVIEKDYLELVNFKKNKEEPVHRWFDYKQGYAAELIHKILNDEKPSKKFDILDPFTGVGTTNLVAQQQGYDSIGLDINPVASFAAIVKTRTYSEKDIENLKNLKKSFKLTVSKNIPQSKLLDEAFDGQSFNQLMNIKGFFENIEDIKLSEFYKLGYLSIIEDCSNRVKDGNGIKIVENKKKIANVYDYYLQKIDLMIEDLVKKVGQAKVTIIDNTLADDLTYTKIMNHNKGIGIVIFSPPYANCFDYCEVYKLELWMGDFVKTYSDFEKYRKMAMRSHVNAKFNHEISVHNEKVQLVADIISCHNVWNKNIPDMIRGYFDDMFKIMQRVKNLMVSGAKCYIVVANSGYRGILVPTDLLIADICNTLGYDVEKIIYARKIRASSQQMKELHDEYENLMRESIIVVKNK